MHDDGWATDAYAGPGPLGRDPEVTSSWYGLEECATLAFDSAGRLVALCGDRNGPVLHVLDPDSMRPVETFDLPDRKKSDKRPWEDLCGGAYFYLDPEDRAVVATTDRRILTVDTDGLRPGRRGGPDRRRARRRLPGRADARLGGQHLVRHPGRPGRRRGRHRRPDPLDLGGEIANSIAADDDGVYLVTTDAFYKVALDDDGPAGGPLADDLRQRVGAEARPAQRRQRDDADRAPERAGRDHRQRRPRMHVQFYDGNDGRLVCEAAVFGDGESASDNSLVAVGDASVVVENNYGYSGAVEHDGRPRHRRRPRPGRRRPGHRRVHGRLGAPTRSRRPRSPRSRWPPAWSTPTRRGRAGGASRAWYLTAIDARTGKTAFSVRTGTGTLFNNHYAAVTLGPDGSAYIATLGGMVRVRDGSG